LLDLGYAVSEGWLIMDHAAPLRWGILGTGQILRKYVEAFRLVRGARLVAVASRSKDRARAVAQQFGIERAHAGYEALIDDRDVDGIVNALPNGLHGDWSIRALQAGKHVLCEKPLACSVAEVERMFTAAHAHKRWLLEGFMYRFHPQMAEAIRRVAAGEIGRVVHIRSSRTSHGREPGNPRFSRDMGGGALLDVGCYCVNFSRMFAGAEPARVLAHGHFDETTGVDLTMTATLEFPGEVVAQFVCSFEAELTYAAEIIGTEGRLLIPHPWMPPQWPTEFYLTRGGKTETVRIDPADVPRQVIAPLVLEIEHLGACILEDGPPAFPPRADAERDSRANMRVIDAIFKAAGAGQPVALTPDGDCH
jgi:D-xylose 1-dehydrogenase (NADP+, D-xylono-1,5-lactone-forming)